MNLSFKKKGGLIGMPEDLSSETQSTYLGKSPKTIQWVVRYSEGLVKTKKQAQYVILIFSALMIILSLFLVFGESEIKLTPEEQLFLDTPPSQLNP